MSGKKKPARFRGEWTVSGDELERLYATMDSAAFMLGRYAGLSTEEVRSLGRSGLARLHVAYMNGEPCPSWVNGLRKDM